MRYRKRPVVVEAYQLPDLSQGGPIPGWPEWLNNPNVTIGAYSVMLITTLEGTMEARQGDWVIQGVHGELYPCKRDIFAATYDEVVDGPEAVPAPPDPLLVALGDLQLAVGRVARLAARR